MTFPAVPMRPSKPDVLRALVFALLAVVVLTDGAGADGYLTATGGSGGAQFRARCADGELLTGMELRTGSDVDAIRPVCVRAYGPREVTPPVLTKGSGLVTEKREVAFGLELPVQVTESGWHGGAGGVLTNLLCPGDQPIVTGIYVLAEGIDTIVVNDIHLFCGTASPTQTPSDLPSNKFEGTVHPNRYEGGLIFGKEGTRIRRSTQRCPAGEVAVGIHGRSGEMLDSLGLICGDPRLTPRPIRAVGRVKLEPERVRAVGRVKLPDGEEPTPALSICESARQARARNSPAAPGLEAQCRAQGAAGELPRVDLDALAAKGEAIAGQDRVAGQLRNLQPDERARRGFHIGLAAAEGHTAPGPGKQRIHDMLRPEEQKGFDAAVSFSLTRNRKRNEDLASKGERIASRDPMAVELRNQQAEGPARRGFDIGMAAAEGQTAPGPGKQAIHDSLPADERAGFATAVSYSLDRNRNADSASRGAAIAEADPDVAAARSAETDVLYQLGFDIASGIFGDPALGAHGNTSTGPGSSKIRNELSASAQRGFDASVAFHLSREYAR
jgi:hypothetical protein